MHANARLTPLVRAEMVREVLNGSLTLRAAAAARRVSDRTVRRWVQRAREEGVQERMEDRASIPRRQPGKTKPEVEARIVALRRERRSYAQIMMVVQVAKSTLSRVLRRQGLNRLASLEPPKPPVLRYERAQPGELLHLDIKKLGRFDRPGVRGTGDRADRSAGAGVESLHVAIDDHSRLAYACLQPDETIPSVLTALRQAVSFYAFHGIRIQRILTDRGTTYRSHAFAALCRELGIKHRFTRPYRPQTNGKAERFIQTLTREWAYARSYASSAHRAGFLLPYIDDYNWHRPHSALHYQTPIAKLSLSADNVPRHNS